MALLSPLSANRPGSRSVQSRGSLYSRGFSRGSSRASSRSSIASRGAPQPGAPSTYSGAFLDFYTRAQTSANVLKKDGVDLVERVLKAKNTGRKQNFVMDDKGVYHYASEMIDRDALQFNLLKDLMPFWKAKNHSVWQPSSGKATLRERAWEVIHFKRMERCLQSEVDDWLAHHPQGKPNLRRNEETYERQARIKGFWDEYHTSFRKLEANMAGKARSTSQAAYGMTSPALGTGHPRMGTVGAGKRGPLPRTPTDIWLGKTKKGGSTSSSWRQLPQAKVEGMPKSRSTGAFQAPIDKDALDEDFHSVASSTFPVLQHGQGKDSLPSILKETKASPWVMPKSREGRRCQAESGGAGALPPIARDPRLKNVIRDPFSERYQRDHRTGPSARPSKQQTAVSKPPARRYVLECENNGIMPTPMPFINGQSLNFRQWNKVLMDNDLLAATATLPTMNTIAEVDLEGNRVLTDWSLVPFLEQLRGHSAINTLGKLSLKHCVQAGWGAMEHVVALLGQTGATHLRELDLGGLPISTRIQQRLCEAIMKHPTLKSVQLADVGLGASSCSRECVGNLLSSKTMEHLDLSWNCFSAEVFQHLGKRVVENQNLKSLCLANCSAAHNQVGDVPILYFLEHLGSDTTLTRLDVSINRINLCGGLVLEDTLQNHRKLKHLHIAHNPLGVFGLRSLLRLLLRNSSGLLEFNCDGCTTGMSDGPNTDLQMFNPNHIGGRYHLDLSRPYNRSLLRMLYKMINEFNCNPDVAMHDIVSDPPQYAHPQRDGKGNWLVPTSGKVSLSVSVENCMEAGLKKVNASSNFNAVLEEHYKVTRQAPPFQKIIPLFAWWHNLNGHLVDQVVILDCICKDFRLSYPQVVQFCKSQSMSNKVICRLTHCMSGGTLTRYLLMLRANSLGEFIKNFKSMGSFLTFNADNPTGHYKLDLTNAADHSIAEQLLLLDRWEAGIARKNGRFPVSRTGRHTQIRNESYMKRELPVPIEHWKLPELDTFELDYVSGRRLPEDAEALDEATFDNMMATMHSSECDRHEMSKVLRIISSFIFCNSMQLRALLGLFRADEDRADVFVLFYLRVVDMENQKVFRVRFADKPDELRKLRKRIGATTMFPFIQPEQALFELDMSIHDERLCASIIRSLADKESPLQNLRNPSFIEQDGTRNPLPTGVPRAWAIFDKCPTSGTFKVQYECSPEDMCFSYRIQLLETYGGWACKKREDEVMWWAALAEAPQDVLEFLEFLVARFENIFEVFPIIDGPDGNGQINKREFEDGLRTLKFNKFKGRGEKDRISNIFRYLDPSGEGQVSKGEWAILDKLWKEMRQSVREFVQFLERTFSFSVDQGVDVLDAAWDFIDEDGSGEIDEQEWVAVVQDGLKYFGPCLIIFHFLDKDCEGTVSQDEFQTLEVFRKEGKGANSVRGSSRG